MMADDKCAKVTRRYQGQSRLQADKRICNGGRDEQESLGWEKSDVGRERGAQRKRLLQCGCGCSFLKGGTLACLGFFAPFRGKSHALGIASEIRLNEPPPATGTTARSLRPWLPVGLLRRRLPMPPSIEIEKYNITVIFYHFSQKSCFK